MGVQPTDFARRSPLYRRLIGLNAEFGELGQCAIALSAGASAEEEAALARELGIADLYALRRGGYKGWANAEYLAKHGLEAGAATNEASNLAYPQADGSLIARLAASEVLILGNLDGGCAALDVLEPAWSMEAGVGAYPVPRPDTNGWIAITGRHAGALFAKICGVDLRPQKFANHRVAQTSLARLNSIVVRADLGNTPSYHLLTDCAATVYMWDCLHDAAAEFAGKPVGLAALRRLVAD